MRYCCDNRCKQGRYCPDETYYKPHSERFYNLIKAIKGLYARMFNRR